MNLHRRVTEANSKCQGTAAKLSPSSHECWQGQPFEDSGVTSYRAAGKAWAQQRSIFPLRYTLSFRPSHSLASGKRCVNSGPKWQGASNTILVHCWQTRYVNSCVSSRLQSTLSPPNASVSIGVQLPHNTLWKQLVNPTTWVRVLFVCKKSQNRFRRVQNRLVLPTVVLIILFLHTA